MKRLMIPILAALTLILAVVFIGRPARASKHPANRVVLEYLGNTQNADSLDHHFPDFPVDEMADSLAVKLSISRYTDDSANVWDSLAARLGLHGKADSAASIPGGDVGVTIDTSFKYMIDKFAYGDEAAPRKGFHYAPPGKGITTLLDYNTGQDLSSNWAVTTKGGYAFFGIHTGFNQENGAAYCYYPLGVLRPFAGMVDPVLMANPWAFTVYDVTGTYARVAVEDTNNNAPLRVFDNSGAPAAAFGLRSWGSSMKLNDSLTVGELGIQIARIDTVAADSIYFHFPDGSKAQIPMILIPAP